MSMVECKLCGSQYKLAADFQAAKVDCRKCGNPILVASQLRRSTRSGPVQNIEMHGTPTRSRRARGLTLVLAAAALIAVAGAFYYLA